MCVLCGSDKDKYKCGCFGNNDDGLCGFCSSDEINTNHNVGSDIWEGGEATQHIDTCNKCGAWRFNSDVIDWEKGPFKSYGKWHKNNK